MNDMNYKALGEHHQRRAEDFRPTPPSMKAIIIVAILPAAAILLCVAFVFPFFAQFVR